jgi:hypothetical protein
MTIIGAVPREDEAVAEEPEPEPEPESEDEPEPELPPAAQEEEPPAEGKKRWWRRRSEDDEAPAELAADAPRHVRVLPPEADDPWEQSFDAPVSAEVEEVGEDTQDDVAEEGGRRIFRRR